MTPVDAFSLHLDLYLLYLCQFQTRKRAFYFPFNTMRAHWLLLCAIQIGYRIFMKKKFPSLIPILFALFSLPVIAGLFFTHLLPILDPSIEERYQALQSDPEYQKLIVCEKHKSCVLSADEFARLSALKQELKTMASKIQVNYE